MCVLEIGLEPFSIGFQVGCLVQQPWVSLMSAMASLMKFSTQCASDCFVLLIV